MSEKQVVIYIVRSLSYSGQGPMELIIHCEKCLLTTYGLTDLSRAVQFQKDHKCLWTLNPGMPVL